MLLVQHFRAEVGEYESFRLQFRSTALDRRIVQVKANWFLVEVAFADEEIRVARYGWRMLGPIAVSGVCDHLALNFDAHCSRICLLCVIDGIGCNCQA